MKAQEGTWTLTAPDGRTWTAGSPLAVCATELRSRRSAAECLENIFSALDQEAAEDAKIVRDAQRYRWLRDHRGSNRLPYVTQYPPQDFDGDRYFVCQIAKHGLDAAVDAAMQMAQPA